LKKGGSGLLDYYGNSLRRALSDIYPEHNWLEWGFSKTTNFYGEIENVKRYVFWLEKQFNISKLDDWYNVSTHRIRHFGGSHVLSIFGGKRAVLSAVYPNYEWRLISSKWNCQMTQKHLLNLVSQIFPDEEIQSNFRAKDFRFERSNLPMELDIYLPNLLLAIEYQGIQHFQSHYLSNTLDSQKIRDMEKRKLCWERGITLLEVPYWWDQTQRSLIATLHLLRPDIIAITDGLPIPVEPTYNRTDISIKKWIT